MRRRVDMGKHSTKSSTRSEKQSDRRQLIALRLPAWSDWDRQVIRGVQRFAHGRPRWRIYVESGPASVLRIASTDVALDGLITGALRDSSSIWQRLLERVQSRMVAITSAVPSRFASIARVQGGDAKITAPIGRD